MTLPGITPGSFGEWLLNGRIPQKTTQLLTMHGSCILELSANLPMAGQLGAPPPGNSASSSAIVDGCHLREGPWKPRNLHSPGFVR